MSEPPRAPGFDNSLRLLAEGYRFGGQRFEQLDSDMFTTRLMLARATCVRGRDAAEMFYHPDRFTRKGAMPPTALKLLQDKGSVEMLAGSAHRHRKQLFMSLMSEDGVQRLVDEAERQWHAHLPIWCRADEIVLHDEIQQLLCRAICAWAGVPLADREAPQRTRELAAMIDNAGRIGPRNWWSVLLRRRAERWAADRIQDARFQSPPAAGSADNTGPTMSVLQSIAWHRDPEGQLLGAEVAAVELLNILRPTVAVSRYMVFAALAMHQFPHCRRRLETDGDDYRHWFAQEVRRYYPFFPLIGGRAAVAFEWHGHRFEKGAWVLLDLYATNHDPRLWEDPEVFRPERFRDWQDSGFDLVPQGAGDHHRGHRCPGERVTIALIEALTGWLSASVSYEVPEQDLGIDLSKMPALPASGLVIRDLTPVAHESGSESSAS